MGYANIDSGASLGLHGFLYIVNLTYTIFHSLQANLDLPEAEECKLALLIQNPFLYKFISPRLFL
jgi:hypothetical protein